MKQITPRYYQADCVQAIYDHLNSKPDSNPCGVLPTGSGKTIVLAKLAQDVAGLWKGRVLILAHVKELLEQAADKLAVFLPDGTVGLYSAGLKSRDTKNAVIVAGIQSVFKRAGELGKFDLIIVDECHLISPNDNTMYREFLRVAKVVNPNVRIVGLTATDYRLDCGRICGPDNILNEVCYEIGVKELIVQGFLCPIKTKAGKSHADLSGVHTRGGEYIESEMAEQMDAIVGEACEEVAALTKDRNSVLVFASSLEHGRHVQERLEKLTGCEVGFVCGDTPSVERSELLARFKGESAGLFSNEPLKYLVNMNVLTTGFDAPNVDAVVLMRATKSPGLYYQMVGRGLRIHPSKQDCIVLDYGENTVRHGPIDAIEIKDKKEYEGDGEAPAKECPECNTVVFAGVARCPDCGFEFPKPEAKHNNTAGSSGVLSGEVTTTEYDIRHTAYYVHQKKGNPDAPTTMRVEYESGIIRPQFKKEWLCFNHSGWARQKAEEWWSDRSNIPLPATTEDAVKLANLGALAETKKIVYREVAGDTFGSIIGYEIADFKPGIAEVDAALQKQDALAAEDQDFWGSQEPALTITEKPPVGFGDWFDGLVDDGCPF